MDQNVDKYRVAIRSKKWWWAIFSYCLDLCVQQSWHLYRATPTAGRSPLDLLAVRCTIAITYLERSEKPARVGRPLGRTSRMDKRVPRAVGLGGKGHLVQCVQTQIGCATGTACPQQAAHPGDGFHLRRKMLGVFIACAIHMSCRILPMRKPLRSIFFTNGSVFCLT